MDGEEELELRQPWEGGQEGAAEAAAEEVEELQDDLAPEHGEEGGGSASLVGDLVEDEQGTKEWDGEKEEEEGEGDGDPALELELDDGMPEDEDEGVRAAKDEVGTLGGGGAEGQTDSGGGRTGEKEDEGLKDDGAAEMGFGDALARPPHGTELFVGGVSNDVTEDDLHSFFGSIGELFEVRLMCDKETGAQKPYAFVTFKSKEDAQTAMAKLSGAQLKGRTVRVTPSQARNRLFIGNTPRGWGKEELRKALEPEGKGITLLELIMEPNAPSKNRGFAFVEYHNHACAELARRNLSKSHFRLGGLTPSVSWADPRPEPDNTSLATVKVVYVKGLTPKVGEEDLVVTFSQFGDVSKAVLPGPKPGQPRRDFGFVHFTDRESALKAVKSSQKVELDGHKVEISLAKPMERRQAAEDMGLPRGPPTVVGGAMGPPLGPYGPSLPPALRGRGGPYPHGDMGQPNGAGSIHGAFPGGRGVGPYGFYGGPRQAPIIYGRGPAPSGMVMVPMMLPDGRVGYVFERESAHRPPLSALPGRPRATPYTMAPGPILRTSSTYDDAVGKNGRRYRPY